MIEFTVMQCICGRKRSRLEMSLQLISLSLSFSSVIIFCILSPLMIHVPLVLVSSNIALPVVKSTVRCYLRSKKTAAHDEKYPCHVGSYREKSSLPTSAQGLLFCGSLQLDTHCGRSQCQTTSPVGLRAVPRAHLQILETSRVAPCWYFCCVGTSTPPPRQSRGKSFQPLDLVPFRGPPCMACLYSRHCRLGQVWKMEH